MYEIRFSRNALEDLKYLKKNEQTLILAEIPKQLSYEPGAETRNRKQLRTNELSTWELRIDRFRVFYSIDDVIYIVSIEAVGKKIHNQLFIRDEPYQL